MAILQDTVVINGKNLGDYGLVWKDRQGWNDSPDTNIITHALPKGDGVFFQEQTFTNPRKVTISGTIHSATVAGLLSNIDEIKARLDGWLQLMFSDDTARFVGCYVDAFKIGDFQPGAIIPVKPFTLMLLCPDPRRYSLATTSVMVGARCPLGTADVRPVIIIAGVSADPTTITLKDHQGNTVNSFTMAAALSSGESWLIDSETAQVLKDNGSGTVTTALSDFSGTLPVLKVEDADYGSESWPYFEATAGAPDTVNIEYQRAWK